MKKLYRNFSGLDPAEFDNWLEIATPKMFKHAKLNKAKPWSEPENIPTRKKKREARSYS